MRQWCFSALPCTEAKKYLYFSNRRSVGVFSHTNRTISSMQHPFDVVAILFDVNKSAQRFNVRGPWNLNSLACHSSHPWWVENRNLICNVSDWIVEDFAGLLRLHSGFPESFADTWGVFCSLTHGEASKKSYISNKQIIQVLSISFCHAICCSTYPETEIPWLVAYFKK